MIDSFLKWCGFRRRRSQEETLRSIRNGMRAMGFDVSDFSDDELKEGLKRVSEVCSQAGVTIEEAVDASRHISEALKDNPEHSKSSH